MRIAITGSVGFIGMHLSQFLVGKGLEPAVSIDSLQPIYGPELVTMRINELEEANLKIDVMELAESSPSLLAEKFQKCDVVIHLAANAGVRTSSLLPQDYNRSNVIGFINVLEAVRIAKPKLFMFASSSSVYGNSKQLLQKEDSATGLNLSSHYAATKWTNEILAQSYAELFSIKTIAMRFFTVYGNLGRPDMAYMSFMNSILTDKTIEIYGSDGGRRSYSHVSDVVRVIYEIIMNAKSSNFVNLNSNYFEALNIGNEMNSSALDIVKLLEKYSGQSAKTKYVNRPIFDVDSTKCSMEKTFSLIPKFEFIDIDRGIATFSEWYIKYFSEKEHPRLF
jgi:UDP-glucuronate 4-epimerase